MSVVFAANEILQSGVDGPYTIGNLVLFKDGECVDSRLYFYSLRKKYRAQAFAFDGKTDIDAEEFMAQFEDYTPPSEIPPPERFWVFFNPNGGTISESAREVIGGEKVGTLPVPTLEDDEFLGWYTELEGGTQVYDSTIVTTNVMYHARWKKGGIVVPPPTQQVYTVTFNANGGTVSPTTRTVASEAVIGELPIPTWNGHAFEGWFTAADGGTQVTASTKVTSHITFYAHWSAEGGGVSGAGGGGGTDAGGGGSDAGGGSGSDAGGSGSGGGSDGGGDVPKPDPSVRHFLYGGVAGAVSGTAATTYDGYLCDANGNVKGTIQVKVGKPGKDGLAAVKATVIGLDGKKKSLKAVEKGKVKIDGDGPTTVSLAGGDACEVTLGSKGMSGTYGNYAIEGALNVFTSKDTADKAIASAVLGKWQGVVNVAWEGAQGWNGLSVSIAAKGKAKVSGTLADGTKVSAKGQLIVGEEWCCIPVLETKKAHLAFIVWLPLAATSAAAPVVVGLGADVKVGKPGTLKGGAAFRLDTALGDAKYETYLPDGLAVAGGAKWTLPKAGKVQLAKNGAVDASKLGENPSALRLTYKAKDGSFKGSFKAYSDVGGKPKGTTVKVTGVLVNGVGYGTASVKDGNVPVKVE